MIEARRRRRKILHTIMITHHNDWVFLAVLKEKKNNTKMIDKMINNPRFKKKKHTKRLLF